MVSDSPGVGEEASRAVAALPKGQWRLKIPNTAANFADKPKQKGKRVKLRLGLPPPASRQALVDSPADARLLQVIESN